MTIQYFMDIRYFMIMIQAMGYMYIHSLPWIDQCGVSPGYVRGLLVTSWADGSSIELVVQCPAASTVHATYITSFGDHIYTVKTL